MQASNKAARKACHEKTKCRIAGLASDNKADQRPENHHPLDPEVEDTRFFGKDLTQGGKEDRCSRLDCRRKQCNNDFSGHF